VTRWFVRYARKERLRADSLLRAIEEADKGIVAADLGGGLVKLRVSRAGGGKSSGYRTIVAYRSGDKGFFLYAYAKNERDNITEHELHELKAIGASLMAYDDMELVLAVEKGSIEEIKRE